MCYVGSVKLLLLPSVAFRIFLVPSAKAHMKSLGMQFRELIIFPKFSPICEYRFCGLREFWQMKQKFFVGLHEDGRSFG